MEINCGECGNMYEVEMGESKNSCPECGFGPDKCSHPIEYRESESIYDVGEGTDVERIYCGKCGEPL